MFDSMVSKRVDRAIAKGVLASELALTGAAVAGPAGAAIGGIAGLIFGDHETVFPVDMIAIPAFEAYKLSEPASFTIFIRGGETLLPTGGEVQDILQAEADMPKFHQKKPGKSKKKLTPYNRFMKKELAALKKKHPRTKHTVRFKKAVAKWNREKRKGGK